MALMDPSVQKELKIRRRLETIFNKEPEEFADKKSYDDFLETRENYILNLLFGDQVADTEAKIAEYQRLNSDSIARNRAAKAGTQGSANAAATIAEPSAAETSTEVRPAFTPSAPVLLAGGAVPQPMTSNYELREDGTIVMVPARTSHFKLVAAASGWEPRKALMSTFKEASKFWL